MKRWTIILAASLLLGACGGQKTAGEDKPPKDHIVKEEQKPAEELQPENKENNEAAAGEKKENPQYKLNMETFALEPIKDANPKVALITIDDAPDQYALEMAKKLKKLNAPAIFFVNGHFIDSPEKEQIVKEIHDLGFSIGNHTYSHADLTTLSTDEQKEEILSVNRTVEDITGEKPAYFRAPFGKNTDFSKKLVKEEGMLLMNWTYGYDWEKDYMTGDAIADIMVNTPLLSDGANLLMHDRKWTNDGLENIVNGLRDKGYDLLDPRLIDTQNETTK